MSGADPCSDPGPTGMEAALRESEERFRTVFEEAPIGISLTAVDGTLLKVNLALCSMLGRTEHELIGNNMASVTHPDDVEMTRAVMRQVVESGDKACQFGKRFIHRDGHVLHAELNSRLLCDAEGRPLHFITHIQDVTDRKRADAILQASERRFREMTDLLPDVVFELDGDFRVTYFNRAASEVFGYTPADLEAGVHIADVLDPAMLPRAVERLRAIVVAGQPSIGVYEIRRKDGSLLPVEIHSVAIVGPDGALAGYRGVVRDIRDRQKAEDAQRMAALGQLAAGVAHEFNNLLAGLMLQAELTADDPTAERCDDLVRRAVAVATRGGEACRNLTTFARPELVRREPLHIEAVIDAGLALSARHIENAETIVTRAYRTKGQRVYADGGQLEQVFVNLFVNACHAMPQGGEITVETRHLPEVDGAGDIIVTVTDTGTGIRREHLPRIFEPFFTTKGRLGESDISGSGLGLSVSHGIIQAHGGQITARSEVGVGTTLELVLPAYAPPPSTAIRREAAGTSPPATSPAGGARVLVAEDVETLSSLIADLLTKSGHEVNCLATTQEAISALEASHYDLVITDLLMPGGGGRRLVEFVRSTQAPVPVLVITGLVETQVEQDVLALGAGAVLHKPFNGAELIRAVDKLLAASDG